MELMHSLAFCDRWSDIVPRILPASELVTPSLSSLPWQMQREDQGPLLFLPIDSCARSSRDGEQGVDDFLLEKEKEPRAGDLKAHAYVWK